MHSQRIRMPIRRPSHRPAIHPLALALHLIFGGTCLAAAILPTPAMAQAQSAAREFDIPAGPLPATLNRIGESAGLLLSFDPALVKGKTAPAIKGRMTAQQALEQALAGSGLAANADGASIVIKTAPPAPVSAKEAVLPVVTVRAGAEIESAWGPVAGYVAKRSATGTKTDTPIIETPQSLSILGRDELDARGTATAAEAMRYVAGVQAEAYGHDNTEFGWLTLRGFDDPYTYQYLDGLRTPGYSFLTHKFEPFGLERIEVLRGPASLVYGQAEAGGIVNSVRKTPQADAPREIQVRFGNFSRRQLAADVGGSIDDDRRLGYRIVAVGSEVGEQTKYPGFDRRETKRNYIAPSFSWTPSADTSFVLLSEFLDLKSPVGNVEFLDSNWRRTGLVSGEPSFDRHDQRQWNVGYQFSHRLNSTWSVRQSLRTAENRLDVQGVWGYSRDPDTGEIARAANVLRQNIRYTAVDTQLTGHFATGDWRHTLLSGIDYMDIDFDLVRFRSWNAPSLNISLPPAGQYGQAVTTPTTLFRSFDDKQRQLGIYVQDQVKVDNWVLSLGGRWDKAKTDSLDRRFSETTKADDEAFSMRAGVNYLFASGVAPYLSYTESFLPQLGQSADGRPFEPTRGKQYELGIKYQPPGTRQLWTMALFDLTKTNVPTTDPDNPDEQLAIGKVRSRGVELEGKLSLTRGLDLTAQYTFNDVKITRDNDGFAGKHPVIVPRHMASAWIDYTQQGGDLRGLGVGLGVRHVGSRYADQANTVKSPAYTLVDASLHYTTGPWRLALNVNNLFDKDYGTVYSNYAYYPGARRTVIATTSYRF